MSSFGRRVASLSKVSYQQLHAKYYRTIYMTSVSLSKDTIPCSIVLLACIRTNLHIRLRPVFAKISNRRAYRPAHLCSHNDEEHVPAQQAYYEQERSTSLYASVMTPKKCQCNSPSATSTLCQSPPYSTPSTLHSTPKHRSSQIRRYPQRPC